MSTPATSIYLCAGVPLNNRYDHTLWFPSEHDQVTYFQSKVRRTFTGYTYIRKSWKLKVEATMEQARVWSYLFFQNGAGKRYFYFINQIEYINDLTVELSIELDVIQTYMFDWILRPCYIDREHSVIDIPGYNTIDEGLDVGEYVVARKETIDLSSNLAIIVASTIDINKYYVNTVEDKVAGSLYDGIYGGFQLSAVAVNDRDDWDRMSAGELTSVLYKLNQDGKSDAVFTMWQYPSELFNWNNGTFETAILKYVTTSKSFVESAMPRPADFDGYIPRNKKLLQYPYCMLYATNNQGGAAIYQYEKFDDDSYNFRVEGNLAPDAIVKIVPLSYKGAGANYDEALPMGNFPICSWNNDTYKLWLAQNQNQQSLGTLTDGLKIVGGVAAIAGGLIATGASGGAGAGVGVVGVSSGIGMITSGASGIASQLAQRADREVQPPQARGTYAGSHNVSRGIQNFDFYHKQIDQQHARIIDDYFTMYGYATRRVKKPNISSRPAFNYVKTIGSNIGGNICMEDLQSINAIFDKGITFWKNTDIGNYELDNAPLV